MNPALLALLERGVAPYRTLLPPRALLHFNRVVTFLMETHPAASRWFAVLHPDPPSPAERERRHEVMPLEYASALMTFIGRPKPGDTLTEDAEVMLFEAEAGLCFLVEARSPQHTTAEACGPALERFVALAFASLFAGLVGAIFRRHAATPKDEEAARRAQAFLWAVMLFRRFDARGRDARTFDWYFVERRSVEQIARHTKSNADAEQEIVSLFLEKLGAFVACEGPVLQRELGFDPARLSPDAKPWAVALLQRELRRPASASRRRSES